MPISWIRKLDAGKTPSDTVPVSAYEGIRAEESPAVSTNSLLTQYLLSTNSVLTQYLLSTYSVLTQYYLSTISVLTQYYLSTISVLT